MDKSTHYEGGKEYTATLISPEAMLKQATMVMDRVTGEMYDPKEAFDRLMNKPEIMASLKRLSIK